MKMNRWLEFWRNKSNPLHGESTKEHYRSYCRELKTLFNGRDFERVLELGCGDGSLFPFLGFDRSAYRGVDFSPAMIDKFSEDFPSLDLVCGDASAYLDDGEYDLLFSNGMLQYFDSSMKLLHFENMSKMLADGGLIVCASIPWSIMRPLYRSGKINSKRRSDRGNNMARRTHAIFSGMRGDSMGHWSSFDEMAGLGATIGLNVECFGSMHYPYRFHCTLSR